MRQLSLAALLLLLSSGCAMQRAQTDLEVVPFVDLPRYMGVWYEVARYPNRFQKGCRDSQATYALGEDGTVDVLNECVRGGGQRSKTAGTAKVADTTTNAKLKVSFFWPFYGDYWIVELGPSYEYAVVSEPKRRYLWILSRTRDLPPETLREILMRLRAKGFDPERLIFGRAAGE